MKKYKLSGGKVRGSLTVETALVLPIFIYAIIAFIYFLQILGIQESLQNSITETGYHAAKYAYVYEYILNYEESETNSAETNSAETNSAETNSTEESNKGEPLVSGQTEENQSSISTTIETIIARSIDSTFYKIKMQDYLDVEKINHSCVKNGFLGINTYLSSYMEEDNAVDIILIYAIKLPLLFIELDDIQMVQRVRLRGWNGHKVNIKNDSDVDSEDNPDTVYITESGTVYHLTTECTHLKLSIREVVYDRVDSLRNDSGGRYKKCILCGNHEGEHGSIYITNTGDRYHWDLDCSGLKRTIISISLSEVGDKGLCKRCGQ